MQAPGSWAPPCAGPGPYADRVRGLIAILWRAGLRISEALALTESDLDPKTGSVLVRAGQGREAQDRGDGRLGKAPGSTGMEKEMRTLCIEDVASHGGPESCVGVP